MKNVYVLLEGIDTLWSQYEANRLLEILNKFVGEKSVHSEQTSGKVTRIEAELFPDTSDFWYDNNVSSMRRYFQEIKAGTKILEEEGHESSRPRSPRFVMIRRPLRDRIRERRCSENKKDRGTWEIGVRL